MKSNEFYKVLKEALDTKNIELLKPFDDKFFATDNMFEDYKEDYDIYNAKLKIARDILKTSKRIREIVICYQIIEFSASKMTATLQAWNQAKMQVQGIINKLTPNKDACKSLDKQNTPN